MPFLSSNRDKGRGIARNGKGHVASIIFCYRAVPASSKIYGPVGLPRRPKRFTNRGLVTGPRTISPPSRGYVWLSSVSVIRFDAAIDYDDRLLRPFRRSIELSYAGTHGKSHPPDELGNFERKLVVRYRSKLVRSLVRARARVNPLKLNLRVATRREFPTEATQW